MGMTDITATDRLAIRRVIVRQLEAFRRDDPETAFSLASPDIQAQFRTVKTFIATVRKSFEPLYRPRSVLFRDLTWMSDCPTQRVTVMSRDGRLLMAYYLMERQSNGNWRIHGCELMPLSEANRRA